MGSEEAPKTDEQSATDLGAEPPKKEGEGEKPVDAPPYAKFHGPPEGDYADITLPDGAVADEALKESFFPIAKELGLSQEGVQKLAEYKTQLDQIQIQRWGDHIKELQTQAKADPVIGGPNYSASVAAGRDSITRFMKDDAPAFRQMLNHYGVGAHPLMIRYMASVGKATGETQTLTNGEGGSGVSKPLHEILYK